MSKKKAKILEAKIRKAKFLVAALATIALILTAGIAFVVLSKDDEAEAATVHRLIADWEPLKSVA